MAAVTICRDFGAQENKICNCFYFSPIYLPWSDVPWSKFYECWVSSQLFQSPFSPLSKGTLVSLHFLPFSSIQLLSRVGLFATPWIAAHQASLSITNSQSLLILMSIELVMPSSHLILCHPLLLLPPIPPSIRVFSNESTLRMRWPKYWSFSFSISPICAWKQSTKINKAKTEGS